MTLANIMFIAFIVGFILGFICCLFLLYLIRREMEQVAEGERVTIFHHNTNNRHVDLTGKTHRYHGTSSPSGPVKLQGSTPAEAIQLNNRRY